MKIVHATDGFVVVVPDDPHVDRTDGGHIIIRPRRPCPDRTALSPAEAIELMRLTMVVGEAMTTVLTRRGIPIGRINYQDNGNWGVFEPGGASLHVHLYGRARDAERQPFGEALHLPKPHTGAYDGVLPLDDDDVAALQAEVDRLLATDKYRSWPTISRQRGG